MPCACPGGGAAFAASARERGPRGPGSAALLGPASLTPCSQSLWTFLRSLFFPPFKSMLLNLLQEPLSPSGRRVCFSPKAPPLAASS